ncbi:MULTISPECIES: hypothetical protein [unclassified Corynebacterium]|nr:MULTISPECIES: hypothetical protein [unclassified Corynebacterium]
MRELFYLLVLVLVQVLEPALTVAAALVRPLPACAQPSPAAV